VAEMTLGCMEPF